MATSSITKNFVVFGKEQAEVFANAVEESFNGPKPEIKVNYSEIDTVDELKKLMAKRKKK
ncbi:MAG: hypothetical protein LUC50_02015 [Ruminococcus sp.]|nr:hypothetical protein [Ruminococcus sp.]